MFFITILLSLLAYGAEPDDKLIEVTTQRGNSLERVVDVLIETREGRGTNAYPQGDLSEYSQGELDRISEMAIIQYFQEMSAVKPMRIVGAKESARVPK